MLTVSSGQCETQQSEQFILKGKCAQVLTLRHAEQEAPFTASGNEHLPTDLPGVSGEEEFVLKVCVFIVIQYLETREFDGDLDG